MGERQFRKLYEVSSILTISSSFNLVDISNILLYLYNMNKDPRDELYDMLEEMVNSTEFELTELDLSDTSDFADSSEGTKFEVDGKKYYCEFIISKTEDGKSVLEYKFYLLNGRKVNRDNFKTDAQYQIALRKSQVGITGTGRPFKVIGNAVGALMRYVKKYNPDYITFTADEANRQRLYATIFRKYGKEIGNYEMTNFNPITKEEKGDEEFWLVKNNL